MRRHQQQSGPAATCPMMAACGVGCWAPSSVWLVSPPLVGWCSSCTGARPRRGALPLVGPHSWPGCLLRCAASAVRGRRPGLRPFFGGVRLRRPAPGRPSRCPLGSLVCPWWLCAALLALLCPSGGRSPSRASRGSPGALWGLLAASGALGASGGRGPLPLSPSALLRPRGGGPACLAVGGPAVVAPSLCPVLARPGGSAPLGCCPSGGLCKLPGLAGGLALLQRGPCCLSRLSRHWRWSRASRFAGRKRPLDNLQCRDAG